MAEEDQNNEVKENGATNEKENNVTDEKEEKTESGEEGSEDESSEEELGLLERPVEILDRKRDRKSTERLALEKYEKQKTPKDELDFSAGRGKVIGEIPYVKHMIDKTHSEDMQTLYRLLFLCSYKPKIVILKKNLRTFCGYPFEKESKHYQKASNMVDRITLPYIKFVQEIFGLEKSGDKEANKERLLNFLMEPKDLETPIPVKKPKVKKTPKKKKKKSPKKSSKPKKEAKSAEEVSSAGESDGEEEGENEEKKKVAKEEKKKKASPKKKSTDKEKAKKSEKKKQTKQPTIKLPTPKKKKTPKKRKADDDSDDDDDEPLVKKAKDEPSDAELKKVVSLILQGADLEQITMKTVVKQVYEKYPSIDLTPRKDFIKNTVKEIIS